jgi:putative membrane protein
MMRLFPFRSLTGVLAASAIVAGATAAPPAGTRMTRDFVQAAAQTDEFEIVESTTVLAQSQDAQVRSFAQAMIQAHRQTTADLKQAVAKVGLEEPKPGMSGDQSAFLAALQSQRGADFDRTYLKQQMLVHHSALTVMQGYAASGDDPTIRQVAIAAVPIVTSHLQMLETAGATSSSPK